MKMIVCVSENMGIGKDGALLFSLPPDMKFFRETTMGKVVIMGKNTLKSFPGGKALKNRVNIVLSRDKSFTCDDAKVFRSREDVLSYITRFNSDDVYVIGGAMIYELFRNDCNEALITKVEKYADCDAFFFDIDADKRWRLVSKSEPMEYEGTRFSFLRYEKLTN